jgi:DNA mismatch endonuclease, patch repair protein
MRQVRSTDTSPERAIRSLLHRMGFRFRLYARNLPGKPDIVLPKYHTVVFVHGCFWHRHIGCSRATTPATNREYWLPKFERTIERDQRNQSGLRALGWNVLVVWECELKDVGLLRERIVSIITQRMPTYSSQDLPLPVAADGQAAYEAVPKRNRKTTHKRK